VGGRVAAEIRRVLESICGKNGAGMVSDCNLQKYRGDRALICSFTAGKEELLLRDRMRDLEGACFPRQKQERSDRL
jgi:hypothetical protein